MVNINGSNVADTLFLSEGWHYGDDRVLGSQGNDGINSNRGNDTVDGGLGDDI